MADLQVFNEVPSAQLTPYDPYATGQKLGSVRLSDLSIGAGDQAMKADPSGLWLGADKFADAKFSVSMKGILSAVDALISGNIVGGTISIGTSPHWLRVDNQGNMWIGATDFAGAPFSVDNTGHATVTGLVIAGYVVTGGAAADINANGTTVSGTKLTNSTVGDSKISDLSANKLTAGTIDASVITVTNLSASNIVTGTLTGVAINGVTITGGTVQTAASGQRVVLNGTANEIDFYTTAGVNVGQIYSTQVTGNNTLFISSSKDIFLNTAVGRQVSVSDTLFVGGDLTALGTIAAHIKAFDIDHPDGIPKKRLRYTAVEGPEVLVICRGYGQVIYPQHFLDVSEPGTIQVVESANGYWVATAVRKGYKNRVVEYFGESPADYPENNMDTP